MKWLRALTISFLILNPWTEGFWTMIVLAIIVLGPHWLLWEGHHKVYDLMIAVPCATLFGYYLSYKGRRS